MTGRALHTVVFRRLNLRPVCGTGGDNPLFTMSLDSVSCGNCHALLVAAMVEGRLNGDPEIWARRWSYGPYRSPLYQGPAGATLDGREWREFPS